MIKEIVSIDKLILVARLSKDNIERLLRETYWRNGNETEGFSYVHCSQSNQPYYRILLLPFNMYARRYYNVMLCTSSACLQQGSLPPALNLALTMGSWKVKQIDIAYDFVERIKKGIYLKPRNAVINNGHKGFSNSNEYICSESNRAKALVYNKKNEVKKKTGVTLPYKHLTRFEIRLTPKLDEQNTLDISNMDWLKASFDKFVFTPNIDLLPLNEEQMQWAIMYQKTKSWGNVPRRQKQKVEAIIKSHKIDFYQLFNNNKFLLFGFLPQQNCA